MGVMSQPGYPERLANRRPRSCANHVTWKRQHTMICDEKALIFIPFCELALFARIEQIFCMRKPAKSLTWRVFYLVAGIGFELMTFRL
jgi:hypothetical protein